MVATMAHFVEPRYAELNFDELAAAPIEALAGLSAADATALRQAFNLTTIGDLGRNKYIVTAVAIAALASPIPRPSIASTSGQSTVMPSDKLLAGLAETRARISRGRVFTTSTTELLREARAEQDARW